MEEPNEDPRVVPELYFLIAKFLSGGPLTETAKTLLKELERVEVLPRRLDWEGNEHAQSYDELAAQYSDVPWQRLAAVCERALRLAPALTAAPAPAQLRVRHSLLGDSLVSAPPKYSIFKKDHTLARRLLSRELGGVIGGRATAPRAPAALLPARLLGGLTLQRRTLGHLSAVYCLAFDCSGRYVVTGADDLLVKVWSALDGRLLATLRGAGAEITDVCVSRDGALLAAGSVDRLVRVWCLASAAPAAALHAHIGTITSVHWSPWARGDVRWLASTSTDGSVAFWTCARDGQFLSQPVQYMERMRPGACHMICAAWSAGGGFLAAGSQDHHVRVYMVDGEGGPKRVLETAVHSEAVDSIAWAHRGLRFVSGSKDGAACAWTLHAAAWRHTLLHCAPLPDDPAKDDGKKLKVTMVCWDLSDEYIITAVSDCSVRVWCSRTCAMVRVLRGHRDEAYVLEAHPLLAGVLLSAGHDGQLFVWDAASGEVLASFLNRIEGQGEGAIFDAKWGGAGTLAAADAHGHLLLLGLAGGAPLMARLPPELFFHTDYRPLLRDAHGQALDEQTEIPPHLMPPPFLVDVEGAPHPPQFQRLVPGRENLALSQLVPAADAARNRIDVMIEALAAERTPGLVNGLGLVGGVGGGPWRGEGVRHTAGHWQLAPVPPCSRPLAAPAPPAVRAAQDRQGAEMNAFELAWWRREMRRRPIMISTAPEPARRRARPRPRARPPPPVRRVVEEPPLLEVESSGNDTSDESVRLSRSRSHSRSSRRSSHSRSSRTSMDLTDSSSHSGSKSDNSSSSQYSDWEAGAALAPPARARRRPVAAKRYSPSTSAPKRAAAGAGAGAELPELYRPGEWLTAVSPRKAPYHPQMGDECVYFRLGHQRYLEAVAEKDLYPVTPRDRPWETQHVYECELVKVVGIKYAIKPPRVACVRLACVLPRPRGPPAPAAPPPPGGLVVVYHDMPDVIDFLVLRQQYNAACARGWSSGDRFRCMIDDSWWTGVVLESTAPAGGAGGGEGTGGEGGEPPREPEAASRWAAAAAARFLSLKVRWDNGEVERLSPWDLEPPDPDRAPSAPGGAVPVLPHELEAVLYRAAPHEWPPRGDRAAACRAIAQHLHQVMSLSAAEPFVAPVDLQLYPTYALVVPYPIDLSTIRERFDHLFYRRAAAAQFDVRYLASNAERFNEPHSPIVRQARLITDLLLYIISHWRDVDVVAKYHELAAAYRSEDDEPPRPKPSRARRGAALSWRAAAARVLRELMASADAEPFREPVSLHQAPDYLTVVRSPMDLGTVSRRLSGGRYTRPAQVQRDIALVFHNSRAYNTNKRSRIYSMTVRLSALFAALWAAHVPPAPAAPPARRRPRPADSVAAMEEEGEGGDSSSSEPLAALAQARLHPPAPRGDSSDSDAPLRHTRRGKGVGKKSKASNGLPAASPPRTASPQPGPAYAPEYYQPANGLRSSSSSSMEHTAVERLLLPADDASLTYDSQPSPPSAQRARRKRRRRSSDESVPSPRPRRQHTHKRTRERFTEGSSPSTSSRDGDEPEPTRRYESDHSYRPRCSSDDEPLQRYRERQGSTPAGTSRAPHAAHRTHTAHDTHDTHARRGGVKLRVRRPRVYNEDSEEDSAAAISKRAPHHQRRRPLQSVVTEASVRLARLQHAGTHTDHDYVNGHTARRHGGEASGGVSISSRGRVRKLTAKARGLLRD